VSDGDTRDGGGGSAAETCDGASDARKPPYTAGDHNPREPRIFSSAAWAEYAGR
jgi:hypothetical protein